MRSHYFTYDGEKYKHSKGKWYDTRNFEAPTEIQDELEKKYHCLFETGRRNLQRIRNRRASRAEERREMLYKEVILKENIDILNILPIELIEILNTGKYPHVLTRYENVGLRDRLGYDIRALAKEKKNVVINLREVYKRRIQEDGSWARKIAIASFSNGRRKEEELFKSDPEWRKGVLQKYRKNAQNARAAKQNKINLRVGILWEKIIKPNFKSVGGRGYGDVTNTMRILQSEHKQFFQTFYGNLKYPMDALRMDLERAQEIEIASETWVQHKKDFERI